MNFEETYVMLNNFAHCREEILLEKAPFKKIESYIYLGHLITMNSNKETDIKKSVLLGG